METFYFFAAVLAISRLARITQHPVLDIFSWMMDVLYF